MISLLKYNTLNLLVCLAGAFLWIAIDTLQSLACFFILVVIIALYFLLFKITFFCATLLIIYAGAIIVLLLFITMFIDLSTSQYSLLLMKFSYSKLFFSVNLLILLQYSSSMYMANIFESLFIDDTITPYSPSISTLSDLYMQHGLILMFVGIILFVSMLGAIYLVRK